LSECTSFVQIRKHFTFEAAHVLPRHPGKCSTLHGHSYRLEVTIQGPIREGGPTEGMVRDFDDLKDIVERTVIDRLDHHSLNDVILNPTVELLVVWIWEQLEPALPDLVELVLWETPTACAVWRGGRAPAR
jgi:6-pyruvoyltetrahydropterin/6-carboxytetrahydropterin synthase